jgi:hypothetical protein
MKKATLSPIHNGSIVMGTIRAQMASQAVGNRRRPHINPIAPFESFRVSVTFQGLLVGMVRRFPQIPVEKKIW